MRALASTPAFLVSAPPGEGAEPPAAWPAVPPRQRIDRHPGPGPGAPGEDHRRRLRRRQPRRASRSSGRATSWSSATTCRSAATASRRLRRAEAAQTADLQRQRAHAPAGRPRRGTRSARPGATWRSSTTTPRVLTVTGSPRAREGENTHEGRQGLLRHLGRQAARGGHVSTDPVATRRSGRPRRRPGNDRGGSDGRARALQGPRCSAAEGLVKSYRAAPTWHAVEPAPAAGWSTGSR